LGLDPWNLSQLDQRFKRQLGTNSLQTDRRQTTDRQTFLSWPLSIREIFKFFFFFLPVGGKERMGGNLYLLTRYASSLRSLAPLAGGWSDLPVVLRIFAGGGGQLPVILRSEYKLVTISDPSVVQFPPNCIWALIQVCLKGFFYQFLLYSLPVFNSALF